MNTLEARRRAAEGIAVATAAAAAAVCMFIFHIYEMQGTLYGMHHVMLKHIIGESITHKRY